MGTTWNDTLIFTISLFKNDCIDPNDIIFSEDEVDAVLRWLTSPDYPTLFHMYDYEYVDQGGNPTNKKYDYYGIFTDIIAETIAEEVIGFTCTFCTNSPFAWTDLKTASFECEGETEINVVVDHSEENREVYPVIKLKRPIDSAKEKEEIQIKQMTDNGKILKILLNKAETTIDCRRSVIYNDNGSLTFEDLEIADLDYIYWPKLYDGTNRIIIVGDVTVTFEWREARKVGAY